MATRTAEEILKLFTITPERQKLGVEGAVRITDTQQVFTLGRGIGAGTGGRPIKSAQDLLTQGFREEEVQEVSAEEARSLGITLPTPIPTPTPTPEAITPTTGKLIQKEGEAQVFEVLEGGGLRGIESPQDPKFQELGGFANVEQLAPDAFPTIPTPEVTDIEGADGAPVIPEPDGPAVTDVYYKSLQDQLIITQKALKDFQDTQLKTIQTNKDAAQKELDDIRSQQLTTITAQGTAAA